MVVTDTQRGTSRSLTTDDSGEYAAPELQPGTYKIHVEANVPFVFCANTVDSRTHALV